MIINQKIKDVILISVILMRIYFCYLHRGVHDGRYYFVLDNSLKCWDYLVITVMLTTVFPLNIYKQLTVAFCLSLCALQLLMIALPVSEVALNWYCLIWGIISLISLAVRVLDNE